MPVYSYLVETFDRDGGKDDAAASRRAIQAYAAEHELSIDREFVEAPGDHYVDREGGNFTCAPLSDRPVGKALFELLNPGDMLITDQPYLLALQLMALHLALGEKGVTLHCLALKLPEGLTLGDVEGVISFLRRIERMFRAEGTRCARALAKAGNGPRGGRPAPGWKHVGPEGKRRRVPDKDQREVMRVIFGLREKGWGWRRISSYLAKHNIRWKKPDTSAPQGYTLEYWDLRRCSRAYDEFVRLAAEELHREVEREKPDDVSG